MKKKPRRVPLARAALVLAVAVPARATADDPRPVKAVSLAEQEMRDDGKHAEHRFPLTLAEGALAADLLAHTTRVSVGSRVDPGLRPAFAAEVRVLPEAGPTLVLRVDFDIAAEPATYEVDIALANRAAWDAAQHVIVKLTHPTAELRRHAPLIVNGSWPLFLGLCQSPREILLGEASLRSRLSRISIEQQDAPLAEGRPVDGRLVFAPPEQIAPGSSAAVPLSFEGSFPVGTTRGRVEMRASQLEHAVALDYEVHVRVTSLAIPFVFLLGAGGGNLLRVRLKKREERLERDLRARDLRARLERLAARSGPEDRAALHLAARALAQKADEELELAIARGNDVLVEAIANRAARQRALVAETGRELALLGQGWLLPPALDITPLLQLVEEAQQRAVDDELAAAGEAMNDAWAKAREIGRGARAWALDLTSQLTRLEQAGPPGSAELGTDLAHIREALAAVREVNVEERPEPLLRAVHDANEAALDLARRLAIALAEAADEAALAAPRPAQAEAIRRATVLPIEGAADRDVQATFREILAAALRLEERARAVVDEMLSEHEDRKQVDGLLADRRFAEALRRAHRLAVQPAGPVTFDMAEEGDESAGELVAPQAGRRRTERGHQPAAHVATSILVLASPRAEVEDRAEVERQLQGTRAARTAISAVVLAAFTWALYEHDFSGTTREIVSLFALGFTTDLSADALFTALERAKRA